MAAITTTTDGEILVVEFLDSKLLDSQQIDQIGRELLGVISRATDKKLFLSFKGVSFMSSAMVNKLVMLNKECKRQKVTLKFSHVGPNVMGVFDITGLFGEDGPLGSPVPNSTKSPTDSTSLQRPEKTPDTDPKDT
jgi:anti-sigma B factor antagonist